MVRVLRAVFSIPRAALLTEDHVTGWLAMDCTNLAFVMKRWIIEFPFVAAKSFLSRRSKKSRCVGYLNAVHQKYRLSPRCGRLTPSLLCYSWLH
jgi:hypothetical protein